MPDQKQALERFLASVEKQAFRMARIASGSDEDALDIVQDAMLGLVRRYAKKPQAQWKPLFFRILQSRIRDWYRRSGVRSRWRGWLGGWGDGDDERDDPLEQVADSPIHGPAARIVDQDSMAALESALKTLPLRQQQTFLLRAWQGMSEKEAATAMQCSKGTIKTHYSRAVHSLRQLLEDHWP